MSVVDDRIVEMKFNNQDFEKNVATSMNTLDKLKQSLNFSDSGKSLDGLQKSVNSFSMSGIQESLSAIQDRFSTMGIVGMTVIQNLTNFALSTLGNIGSKIKDMIISGGISRAMNIENAKFQLEGLGIKYNDVFDAIDYAVTNTAYSLDAAAQAASQLSAAGLDYKDVIFTHEKDQKELTQMSMALRAVSGVAAQTQSDYSMVARYFQDVANAGKVTGATLTYMTQVLNLPVEQNLAEGLKAIADGSFEASESVQNAVKKIVKGTEVSAEDVKNFASKGLISFDMFSTIMFNKYADHAVDANRTIMGVMANIRSAFAKIGAEFVQPIIEIDGVVVRMLDSIRAKVNQIKPMIIPFAKTLTDSIKILVTLIKEGIDNVQLDWMTPFFKGLSGIVEGLTQDILVMRSAFNAIFPKDTSNRIQSFAERFKEFGETFAKNAKSADNMQILAERFKGLFSLLSAGKTIFQTFLNPFKGFIEGLKESAGFSGSFIDSFADWAKNLDKMLKESEKLKEIGTRLFDAGKEIGSSLFSLVSDVISAFRSLKEGPQAFADNLFDNLITNLGHTVIKIAEILTGRDLSRVTEVYDSVVAAAKKIVETLAKTGEWAYEKIKSAFDKIKSIFSGVKVDGSGVKKIADSISDDTKPLEKVLNFIDGLINGFVSAIQSILPLLKSIVEAISIPLKTFFGNMKEFFIGGDFFKKAGEDAPVIIILSFITRIVKMVKKSLKDISIVGTVNDFFDNLSTSFKRFAISLQQNQLSSMVLSFAGALLMLAMAMSIIAGIDQERLGAATMTITHLIGSMALIAKMLSSNPTITKWTERAVNKTFPSFIALAGAVYILAMAVKKIASVPADRLWESTAVVTALLATMTIMTKILTLGKGHNNLTTGLGGLIAMAASVYILAFAISKVSEVRPDRLWESFAVVEILLVTLGVISKLLSSSKLIAPKMPKGYAVGLVAMGAAIFILAKTMQEIAEIKPDRLWESFAVVEALIATMALVSKFLSMDFNFSNKLSSKSANMVSIGIGMIAIAAAMKIFASAAKQFGDIDWEALGKAGAAMGTIIALITVFSKLTASSSAFMVDGGGLFRSAKSVQSMIELGVGLIAIAAAMKIFASAAEDFADLKWEELGKAGAAITVLLAEIGAFSYFVSGSNLLKVSAALLVFGLALTALVPGIMAFSSLSVGAMVVSLAEVAGIILLLAGMSKLLNGLFWPMMQLNIVLSAFGASLMLIGAGLAVLSGGVATAMGAIDMIVTLVDRVIKAFLQTAMDSVPMIVDLALHLITSFLQSMEEYVPMMVESLFNIIVQVINKITEKLPELATAISNLTKGIFDAFSISIGDIDPEKFVLMMAGITAFMLSIAAAAFVVQKAMLGVLGISAVMLSVAAMFMLIKMIGFSADEVLKISEGMAIAMLSLAATMLIISLVPVQAAAMGIAGFAIVIAGLAAILAALGGLKQIPGFDWIIGEGTVVLGQIGKAIGEFVGNIIGGVAVGIASRLPEIADSLSAFATGLTPFMTTMKNFDDRVVDSTLSLVGIILALTAAEVLDSLTSWFTGGTDISKFGQQLEEFAPHIMAFAESVRGINGEDVQNAANAGKALAEMAAALPNEGGVVGWFMGENDMKDFGKKLVPFGKAMMEFSKSVEGLDKGVVENAAAAGMAVANLAKELPNSGGVVGWFMGENDMDQFGEQLVIFGKKIMAFSIYVEGLDKGVVENAANAGRTVAALANELPNTGGVAGWFLGDNDMETFGTQLVAFGRSIMSYADIIKDLDTNIIANTATAIKTLVTINNDLPSIGGVKSWFSGNTDFESFGESLVDFGESMVEFSDSLYGIDLANVTGLAEGVRGLIALANEIAAVDTSSLLVFAEDAQGFANQLQAFGNSYVTDFINEFTNSSDAVVTAITTFIETIIATFEAQRPTFLEAGSKLTESFGKGIMSRTSSIKSVCEGIIRSALNAFNSSKGRFYQVGVECMQGLINGLASKEAELQSKINSIAAMMAQIANASLQIHSPSRVFREIGMYTMEGLILGITDEIPKLDSTMNKVSNSAINTMREAIKTVSDSVNDDMNLNPVITPVLDLTNLTRDVDSINGLFNRSVAISNARAATISQYNPNTANLQNAQINGVNGNTTFIQNNYSPKALSRVEIYRQTKNQFAQYKEAML